MSRAFVNEERLNETTELPPLPLSPHPNYVTPRGLAQLQQRLTEAQARLHAADPAGEALDASPSPAEIRREIAWLEARIAAAIPVLPPAQPPQKVAFGATVEVADHGGRPLHYRIVGEDEADPTRGLVSWVSPLGQALIGAGVGDVVHWARPAGAVDIEVLAIRFDA